MTILDMELVQGSKGGGKGKGGGGGSNASNTLRSKARARWVEIIGEGPCVGLIADGVPLADEDLGRACYFEQTPVKNENETENFKNVIIAQRRGYPDQEHFTGFPQVETPFQVETRVKFDTGPVVRTINEENADAVRVIVRLPSLVRQEKKSGKLKTASVSYGIDVRGYNGSWQRAHTEVLTDQKCTSAVQRAHRIELPLGGYPWDIRMVRLTEDSENDRLQNDTWFESYTVLVEGKFTYPNTALVAMEVNAEDMGQSIPARNYRYRGLIINVPKNYDPIARTYTGGWDGTFKKAWTNNPAWIFYDLLTNDRYGLGEFVSAQIVDKWTLYAIGQYCDQKVKTGFKNSDTGAEIWEPRYTFNGVLRSREDAWRVLQQISTSWRGMAYWSLGQVFASADMPEDPAKLFSPANVVGDFNYSGTSQKARHSVCLVSYNNPDDFFRPDVEPVISDEALNRWGWREKSVSLTGCTSRSLAHRYGKWILDVELNETETVDFTASWDSTDIRPGNIIAIADPNKAQVRIGGRLKAAETRQLWLDAPFKPTPGSTYSVYVTLPDGEVKLMAIDHFTNQIFDEAGESLGYDRMVLTADLPELPLVNSMWVLRGTDVAPRQYRVITMKEDKKNLFKITALFHDPNKYARVENMKTLQPIQYTRPKNESLAPENLRVDEVSYLENGMPKSNLTLSWTNPRDYMTKEYEVGMLSDTSGYNIVGTTKNNSIDITDLPTGEYTFFVYAISQSSVRSQPASLQYEIAGWAVSASPTVSHLKLEGSEDGVHFAGTTPTITWQNNFPASTAPTADDATVGNIRSPFLDYNTVTVWDATSGLVLRVQKVDTTSYNYTLDMNTADGKLAGIGGPTRNLRFDVTVTDTLARTSNPATITISNPVPPAFNPNAFVFMSNIHLEWPAQVDDDFAGTLIWIEENDTFDPMTTTPRYDGMGGSYVFTGEELKTYYIRAAAYDAFGRTGLNISPPLMVQTKAAFDMDPPEIPTGLAATSVVANGVARVTVTWNANTENDMAAYDLQIKQGSGNWVSYPVAEGPFEFDAIPAVSYQIQIRARDKSGNASGYSEAITHVAAKDEIAPGVPTDFTVTPGLTSLWLAWVNPADADLAFVEILESETNDPETATVIAMSIGSSFARTGLANNVTRYYWLRAVDTSANASELTGVEFAETAALPNPKTMTIVGLTLTPNSPAADQVAWGAFDISIGSPTAGVTTNTISAGNFTWTAGALYLYYVEGETTLRSTTSISTIFTDSGYVIAVYRGGNDIQMADGKVMISGNDLIAGTVGASQLVTNEAIITGSVQIKDAIITSAKIVDLDAVKIKANTTISNTIIVGGGDSLGTIRDRAADPATRVNAGSTLIEPGRVKISNAGTIANWAMGGDSTEINGGALAAGTVKANAIVVGARNITLNGLQFEHNAPAANRASWTAGSISYMGDDGTAKTVAVAAGSTGTWSSGTMYIYWVKDAAALSVTTNVATAFGANCIVLATYQGSTILNSTYGRTVIDGGNIKADTVTAVQISVGTLSAISADVGTLTAGMLRSSDSKMQVDLTNKRILIAD
ncbi:putative phage tail protein [Rhizobium azibense]|nr:putative phage tail protein [Rhizobium azibense]